jgi:hypothetical protein
VIHNLTKPRRQNSRRDLNGKRAPGFLQFLRGRQCAFADAGGCEGKVEAMHLDFAGKMEGVDPALGKGTASKVADRYALPGCNAHARRQCAKGWDTFIAEMKTSREALMVAAARLWNAWPGRRQWEAKMEERA